MMYYMLLVSELLSEDMYDNIVNILIPFIEDDNYS